MNILTPVTNLRLSLREIQIAVIAADTRYLVDGASEGMKNIAVILAAGSGSRFGSAIPKQFVKLAGKPLIVYTLDAFQHSDVIDEIMIVTRYEYTEVVQDLVNQFSFDKVTKILSGGKERYDSSWSAIQAVDDDECHLIFHDAVRPFVSQRIIRDCVQALNRYNAVDVVVDPTDTIVKVCNENIMSIPDRRYLRRGQTPQAFTKKIIESAYQKFLKDPEKIASDDCGIVLKYLPNEPICIVSGEEKNFKVTHQQDIYLADNYIKDGLICQDNLTQSLLESKLSNKVVVIFGGSSGIGESLVALCRHIGANVYSFSRSNGCDITKPDCVVSALKNIIDKQGRIDYIINTVGVLIKKPLSFASDDDVLTSCHVNYMGAIHIAKYGYEYLKHSHGMLINFTSSSFTRGRSGYSLYSSSKAAIVNLTQALSEEWQSTNVRVNCINPERTDTPMRRRNFGIEPEETLLTAQSVAETTLAVMTSTSTGQIVLVRKPGC